MSEATATSGAQPGEASNGVQWKRDERKRDGEACQSAALEYLTLDWASLVLCPPDHWGMKRPDENGKLWHECAQPGKRPWHRWKDIYQTPRLPTAAEGKERFRNHPTSNVGMAYGRVSGLVGVDIDGPGGEKLLADLSKGDLPPTLEFRTPGGGRRLLYAVNRDAKLKTTPHKSDSDDEHQELRLQAEGAQTVMPPSRHANGGAYRWLEGHGPNEIPPAPAPAWLLRELDPNRGTNSKAKQKAKTKTKSKSPHPFDVGAAHTERNRETALSVLKGLSATRADDYDDWLIVGMVLHSISSDSTMLGTWDEWSRSSQKYKDDECARKWESFSAKGSGNGRPVTIGSLIYMAKQDGWTNPKAASETTTTDAPADPSPDDDGDDDATVGLPPADVIRMFLVKEWRPTFRRAGAFYSDKEGREVKRSEALGGGPSVLMDQLEFAEGAPKREDLPRFFRAWAPTAWADLMRFLPEEEGAEELSGGAEEDFRSRIKAGLLRFISLGDVREKDDITVVERRTLIDWCRRFAKRGGWGDVRGHKIWSKLDTDGQLCVALKPEVFGQVADRDLERMPLRRFTRLALLYRVGARTRTAGGSFRAVELHRDFINELLAGPGDDEAGDAWEGPGTDDTDGR